MQDTSKKVESAEIENLNQDALDVESLTPEELESASGGCGCFGVNQAV